MEVMKLGFDREDAISNVLCAYAQISEVVISLTMNLWVNLELSMAQVKALVVIASVGQTSIGRIAESLDVSVPTASHLVEKLARSGLVSRTEDQADRRRAVVTLTDDGRDLMNGLRQGSREQLREWFQKLDEHELEALQKGITALARAVTSNRRGQHTRRHPASSDTHS